TKLDATGSTLLYSTYLGGRGADQGQGIAVDASGNAYVTGFTYSTDFPTTEGAFQTTLGGNGVTNAFVTKLATLACQQVSLVDPVPDLLSGQAVTSDSAVLAIAGRVVQGVAADGVTQVVLRIPARSVGDQVSLTVMHDQSTSSTSVGEDGAVADVVAPSF